MDQRPLCVVEQLVSDRDVDAYVMGERNRNRFVNSIRLLFPQRHSPFFGSTLAHFPRLPRLGALRSQNSSSGGLVSRQTVAFLLALILTVPAAAQDLSGYKKVLLPVYTSQPISGLNGSTFSTVLKGYAETDVRYFARVVSPGETPVFFTQRAFVPIFDGEPLNYGPERATGRFLFIEQARFDEVAIQYYLRSSDATNQESDQMTALPVVSTPLTRRGWILNIPNFPILTEEFPQRLLGFRFRNLLRIYDFEGDGRNEVDVHLFNEGLFGRSGRVETKRVKLDRRDGSDPTFPFYAEVPIENRCFARSARTPCAGALFRVEIEPISTNLQYWAFVSTTDMRTQHVTIFEPQPRKN